MIESTVGSGPLAPGGESTPTRIGPAGPATSACSQTMPRSGACQRAPSRVSRRDPAYTSGAPAATGRSVTLRPAPAAYPWTCAGSRTSGSPSSGMRQIAVRPSSVTGQSTASPAQASSLWVAERQQIRSEPSVTPQNRWRPGNRLRAAPPAAGATKTEAGAANGSPGSSMPRKAIQAPSGDQAGLAHPPASSLIARTTPSRTRTAETVARGARSAVVLASAQNASSPPSGEKQADSTDQSPLVRKRSSAPGLAACTARCV